MVDRSRRQIYTIPQSRRARNRCAEAARELNPHIRPRPIGLCLQHSWLARSATLRWVTGGVLPPHGLRRCAAAARTLGRSPSWHAPLSTPPLISLFDGSSVPCQVPLVDASTSPLVDPAPGRPWPLPRRQQRARRRRGGSARSFSSAILCPSGPPGPRRDRV